MDLEGLEPLRLILNTALNSEDGSDGLIEVLRVLKEILEELLSGSCVGPDTVDTSTIDADLLDALYDALSSVSDVDLDRLDALVETLSEALEAGDADLLGDLLDLLGDLDLDLDLDF